MVYSIFLYDHIFTHIDTTHNIMHSIFHSRTIRSVISVWLDTYPDDFREDPDYQCLHTLMKFSERHLPDSDLSSRAKHKLEKFQKEASNRSGIY